VIPGKWQPLESAIQEGFSLEDAAFCCDIPIDEAKQWVKDREALEVFESAAQAALATDAFAIAIEELKKLTVKSFDDSVRQRSAAVLVGIWKEERKRLERKIKQDKPEAVKAPDGSSYSNWLFQSSQ